MLANTEGGMNRGIYSASSAMLSAQRKLDIVSNNMANINTTGYKRDEIAFAQTLELTLRANGGFGQEIGTMAFGSPDAKQFTKFDAGQLIQTGNALDVAIEGQEGMFAIDTPNGVQFNRNGSFQLSPDGQLINQDGYPVLDMNQQPIQIPQGEFTIESDGTIQSDGRAVGRIGIFSGTFTKVGGGYLASQNAEHMPDVDVRWKSIEASNVNSVESMVEMIQLQRHFDIAQRSILQQDELTQKLISSLGGG